MILTTVTTHILYIGIITVAFCFVFLSQHVTTSANSISISNNIYNYAELGMLLISFIILVYPLAARTCGADTEEYYRIYTRDFIGNIDITFNYICKFLHSFIASPKIGLGLISATTLLIAFHSIITLKNTIDVQISFLAYFTTIYFYLYNYMRIMVAVSLILLGYSLLIRNKRIEAIIPLCLAVLFHKSAAVVLLVYMGILCFRKHKILIVSACGLFLVIFIMKPMAFLSLISSERYSSQIDYYAVTRGGIGVGTTLRILPFFVLLFIYRYLKDEFVYEASFYFCIANLMFSFLGYYVSTASRISNMYFVFHTIFFLPWILKRDNNTTRRNIVAVFGVLYLLVSYYMITRNFSMMKIIPYA